MLYPCFNILLKSLHLLCGLDGIDFPEKCHQDGKALNSFAPEAKILFQIPDCQVEAQVVFQGGEFPFTGFEFWIFLIFSVFNVLFNDVLQGEEFLLTGFTFLMLLFCSI